MHINVYKHTELTRNISTNCKLFNPNERYILTISEKELVFKLASFTYNGTTYSPTSYFNNIIMTITAPNLDTGQYEIYEESNEDEIIIILV